VYVVLLENKSYSQVMGSSSMPYLKGLASQYALATNFYANTHPSIGNYFMLTTGKIITNSDGYTGTVSSDNLVRHFLSAGKTWKVYAESLPYAGYIGGDRYPYIKHHNPFAYFSDVRNSSAEKMNIVPFTQFAGDLANRRTPDYSFIVPNNRHNAHDCPSGMSSCTTSQKLRAADDWLKANIARLFSDNSFQQDGLLVVVFDESTSADKAYGGGHIVMVAAGPKVKRGYKATGFYQHEDLLRMLGEAVGLESFPGAGASASNMNSLFGTSGSSSCVLNTADHTVTICTPASGSTYNSPVHVLAQAVSSTGAKTMAIYLDGTRAYSTSGNKVDTYISAAPGTHRLTVQVWDNNSFVFKSTIYFIAT
jgi:phosphatidylinositol-3-phosphatase